MALGSGVFKGFTRAEAETELIANQQTRWMVGLFKYGIPIVLASGNEGENGRQAIDQIPQVLETDDFPVINVGAATHEGKAAPFSQGQGT